MLSEEEAKERFEESDQNGDGLVTWSEYLFDSYGVDEDENTIPKSDGSEEDQVNA